MGSAPSSDTWAKGPFLVTPHHGLSLGHTCWVAPQKDILPGVPRVMPSLGRGYPESAATLTSGLSLLPSCGWERESPGHQPGAGSVCVCGGEGLHVLREGHH